MAMLSTAILILLGVVVVVAAIVVGILVASSQRHPSGQNPTPTAPPPNVLRFPIAGVPVTARYIEMERASGGYDRVAEVRTTWPDAKFRCEIYPHGEDKGSRRLPGLQSLDDGNQGEHHFSVQGNDLDKTYRMLNTEVQQHINNLYRFGDLDDFYLGIGGEQLIVRKRERYAGDQHLTELGGLVVSLRREILAAMDSGITLIPSDASNDSLADAFCEICGEAVVDDVVHCRTCKTPHHRDCWEYFGRCSIYACGEVEFIAEEASVHRLLKPKRIPRARSVE